MKPQMLENLMMVLLWVFVFITCIVTHASIECLVGTGFGMFAFILKMFIDWTNDR